MSACYCSARARGLITALAMGALAGWAIGVLIALGLIGVDRYMEICVGGGVGFWFGFYWSGFAMGCNPVPWGL